MQSFWSTVKFYWGINLTLLLCIALATGVLVGSLIVGDSMRGSLYDLTLERLGNIHHALVAENFFDPKIVKDPNSYPVIILNGTVDVPSTKARASKVNILGVEDTFFNLWEQSTPNWVSSNNDVFPNVIINEYLKKDLNVEIGDSILVRIPNTGQIHPEFLLGNTDTEEIVNSIRVVISDIVTSAHGGRFNLNSHQSLPLNIYIPLNVLQEELSQKDKVNAVFTTDEEAITNEQIELTLDGIGINLRQNHENIDIQSEQYILSPYIENTIIEIATKNNIPLLPTLTYLANRITKIGAENEIEDLELKSIPYSTILAAPLENVEFANMFNATNTRSDEDAFTEREIEEKTLSKKKVSDIEKEYQGQFKDFQDRLMEIQTTAHSNKAEYQITKSQYEIVIDELNSKINQISRFYSSDEIYLNKWAAEDLGVKIGDKVSLSYYKMTTKSEYITETAYFLVKGIVEIDGIFADTHLIPQFPGIHETDNISEWNSPFPLDYSLIRDKDEEYWDKYKTIPKGFITLKNGQKLWKNRFGVLTSIRFGAIPDQTIHETKTLLESELLSSLDLQQLGFQLISIRSDGLISAKGSSDFAMLFSSMSGLIIIAAAILIGLVFKLGVEQRSREIGILQSMGYTINKIRRRLLSEAMLLTIIGSMVGCLFAIGYAKLLIYGLHTWWLPAIGTPIISLHVRSINLIIGIIISSIVVMYSIFLAVRKIDQASIVGKLNNLSVYSIDKSKVDTEKRNKSIKKFLYSSVLIVSLFSVILIGDIVTGGWEDIIYLYVSTGIFISLIFLIFKRLHRQPADFSVYNYIISLLISIICTTTAILINFILLINNVNLHEFTQIDNPVSRFIMFTLGNLTLCFVLFSSWLKSDKISHNLSRLHFAIKNIARQSNRSESCVMTISLACCIIVAVGANRQDAIPQSEYTYVAESSIPIVHDLNTTEGRRKLNFSVEDSTLIGDSEIQSFRVLPGEDISCLNLYKPVKPQILGAPTDILNQDPWTYLNQRTQQNRQIPTIGDENSIKWILQHDPNENFVIDDEFGQPQNLRIETIKNSLFQSQLIISETNFLKLFPSQRGYQFFLIKSPESLRQETGEILETTLSDFGFDVTSASDRLAGFRSVQNTYISTFQSLGGLGLLIGTFGMALVMIRNIIERKGELATLRAFGFSRRLLSRLLLFESSVLLIIGMLIGIISGIVGIIGIQGGLPSIPWISLSITLLFVLIFGIIANMLAVSIALRIPLISTLKSE
ncbi:ABC transporter permease [Candidatus Poribacteria bacterium]|nr:ABC transporter permease [Candidatus Poribacteria bacterium]